MQPGCEVDALVAEKVMELEIKPYEKLKGVDPASPLPEYSGKFFTPIKDNLYGTRYQQWEPIDIPPYSTDIAAAWEVVEKLKDRSPNIYYDTVGKKWHVGFDFDNLTPFSESLPHAICLAALKSVNAL